MSWKKFDEIDRDFPESIVVNRINGFETATEGFASLAVIKSTGVKAVTNPVSGEFKFELILYSNLLAHYRFTVMSFGYGVTLSPIYFILESSINEELYESDFASFVTVEKKVTDGHEFQQVLNKVFESKAFESVVRGLIKISKKANETA